MTVPNDKEHFLLNKEDIVAIVRFLVNVVKKKDGFDNIDHLGNRRVRRVGELLGMYGVRWYDACRARHQRAYEYYSSSERCYSKSNDKPEAIIASVNTFIKQANFQLLLIKQIF